MNECKHEFVDIYDEEEKIPDGVIESASQYRRIENEAHLLAVGKIKTKKHVLTYCSKCGTVFGRDIKVMRDNLPPELAKKPTTAINDLDIRTE
jgi:hypothetical protein